MNIVQELSIVKDNIAEYGMTNITQLEYDAIYEQGRRDAEKELNALGECEYRKGRADAYEEVDNLIAEMTEIAESQMMFRHAEICELIRERIKVICNGR